MNIGLAERLRRETRDIHAEVERTGVMGALLRGRVDRAGYVSLLRNLHAIYGALEAELARYAAHPDVAQVVNPALHRGAALRADLESLHGANWAQLMLQPAAQRHGARLHELGLDRPAELVAHAYVRYLGDLSGGQMLRAIVARGLGLRDAAGTAFYDFGTPDEVAARAQAFRRGLDAIADRDGKADRIVAEARFAFGLHAALFVELADAQALPAAG